jgi:hypothetical protein
MPPKKEESSSYLIPALDLKKKTGFPRDKDLAADPSALPIIKIFYRQRETHAFCIKSLIPERASKGTRLWSVFLI